MSPSENPIIASLSNPTVKRLVKMRDNRFRRKSGHLIVDGWRETFKAIHAGLELSGVYTTAESTTDAEDIAAVMDQARQQGVLRPVSEPVMQKIGYGESHRGVVAEFIQPDWHLDALKLSENPVLLVLDQIEKPGNLGAVFRCADAVGVDAIVVCDGRTDLFNPNVIRSSLGTVFSVAAASCELNECASFLSRNNIRPVAARVESSSSFWQTDLLGSIAVVLGNEANGLENRWLELPGGDPVAAVQIPMFGQADSLNISVSAALLAYEVRRQRSEFAG